MLYEIANYLFLGTFIIIYAHAIYVAYQWAKKHFGGEDDEKK